MPVYLKSITIANHLFLFYLEKKLPELFILKAQVFLF